MTTASIYPVSGEEDPRAPVHASRNPCFRPGSPEDRAIKALRRSVYGSGHTSEQIGQMLVQRGLYRSKRGSAASHVRACLNPGKSEFFSPSELLAIQQHTSCHDWSEFEAGALGKALVSADPEAELDQARGELEACRRRLDAAAERVEACEGRAIGRPIPRFVPTQGAKFSRVSRDPESALSAGPPVPSREQPAPLSLPVLPVTGAVRARGLLRVARGGL